MTKIRMDWNTLTLTAEGHNTSGGPEGQNIICAGISAITQALLNYLLEEQMRKFVDVSWFMHKKSGLLRIRAKPYAGHTMTTKACFQMTISGLRAIESNYPADIEIEEVKDSGNI